MKKRRIAITVFRRRTTLVMRDGSNANHFELPGDGERSYPVRVDEAHATEIDPGKIQITNPEDGVSATARGEREVFGKSW